MIWFELLFLSTKVMHEFKWLEIQLNSNNKLFLYPNISFVEIQNFILFSNFQTSQMWFCKFKLLFLNSAFCTRCLGGSIKNYVLGIDLNCFSFSLGPGSWHTNVIAYYRWVFFPPDGLNLKILMCMQGIATVSPSKKMAHWRVGELARALVIDQSFQGLIPGGVGSYTALKEWLPMWSCHLLSMARVSRKWLILGFLSSTFFR